MLIYKVSNLDTAREYLKSASASSAQHPKLITNTSSAINFYGPQATNEMLKILSREFNLPYKLTAAPSFISNFACRKIVDSE